MIQESLYHPTHLELVEYSKKWLHQKHSVVITEMGTAAGEIPDAIGWTPFLVQLMGIGYMNLFKKDLMNILRKKEG